jgi:hypothetical protein
VKSLTLIPLRQSDQSILESSRESLRERKAIEMRRVGAAAPRSNGSMLSIESNDKQLQERQQRRRTKTAQLSSVVVKVFFALTAVFVVADVLYLYRLNNTPLGDTKKSAPATAPVSTNIVGNSLRDTNNNNDKGPILAILEQAGIDTLNDLDAETINALPTWSQIQQMIGDKPIIHGLETCQAFRDSIDPTVKFFGIAGTFNTG